MKIEMLSLTEYDENNSNHDSGQLVMQVVNTPGQEGVSVDLRFPLPDRGRDAEIDYDDCSSLPLILFWAMVGRMIPFKELEGKFFAVTLPTGVFNG